MSTRKNTLYNMAYRVFSIFLPLVTAPHLSRTVGQTGVGLYSYAWSISYIFGLIGLLGLVDYGVRAISRAKDNRDDLNRTFSELWRMQLLVAGVTLAAWLVYVFFIAGDEKHIALHLTLMSVSCLVNLDWALMGLDQFKPIALRNTAVKLLAAGAVFLFVKGPEDLWVYAFVWSLSTFVGCLSCITSLRGKVKLVPVTWKTALRHLPPCAMLFLSVLAVSVYRTMDKVMVGALSSMEQNGLYENAEKIIYCLSGFISAFGTVMLPKASNLFKRGEEARVRHLMATSTELIMCMVTAMAFGVAAVAEDFAPLFFGEDFLFSGTLMIPLAFTLMAIGFANVVRTHWILPQRKDHIFVRSVSCGAAVNLVVNLLLIPRMGAMGAVVGTLIAEFTVPAVQWLHLRRSLPYGQMLKTSAVYTIIGLCMLLCVRAVNAMLPFGGWLGLILQVMAGMAVYGVLTLLWWKKSGRNYLKLLKR